MLALIGSVVPLSAVPIVLYVMFGHGECSHDASFDLHILSVVFVAKVK